MNVKKLLVLVTFLAIPVSDYAEGPSAKICKIM